MNETEFRQEYSRAIWIFQQLPRLIREEIQSIPWHPGSKECQILLQMTEKLEKDILANLPEPSAHTLTIQASCEKLVEALQQMYDASLKVRLKVTDRINGARLAAVFLKHAWLR